MKKINGNSEFLYVGDDPVLQGYKGQPQKLQLTTQGESLIVRWHISTKTYQYQHLDKFWEDWEEDGIQNSESPQ